MTTPLNPLASKTHPNAPLDLRRPLCKRISSLCRPFIRALPLAIATIPVLQATPTFPLVPITSTTLFLTLFAGKLAMATPTPSSSSPFINIGDFLINTYTTNSQQRPSAAGLSDGGFVVTWHGEGQGDNVGIFGQRYHANGTIYGAEFQANNFTTNFQRYPSAASLSDGGFVVTWGGDGQGDNVGIFGQRYHSNDTIYGTEFQANNYTRNFQRYPSTAGLFDGGFVVTWEDEGQGDAQGIFGQRYHANGTTYGTEFRANNYTTSGQWNPNAVGLSNSGFIVTWEGEGQGDTYGIFGQRYHANGTANGAEFRVNNYTTNSQQDPSAAGLSDGGFVVTWDGEGQGDTYGIFGQRYYANGTTYGTEFRANNYTTNSQFIPSAAGLSDGGFVVTWHGEGQGDSFGIFGQRYHANGTAYGVEFLANTYTTNTQRNPSTAGLSDGGFVVTWEGEEQPSSNIYDIYGKRYDRFGEPIPWEQASFTVSTLPTPPFNSATSAVSSLPPSSRSQTITRTSPFTSFSPSTNPPPLTNLPTHTSPSGLSSISSSLSPSRYAAPSWTLRLFSSIEILYQQPVDIVVNSQVIGTFVFSGGEGSLNSTNPNILNLNFDPSFFPEDGQTIPLFAISEGNLQDWQNIFLGDFTDCNEEGYGVEGEVVSRGGRDTYDLVFAFRPSCVSGASTPLVASATLFSTLGIVQK